MAGPFKSNVLSERSESKDQPSLTLVNVGVSCGWLVRPPAAESAINMAEWIHENNR
jgi:hypothetical protein